MKIEGMEASNLSYSNMQEPNVTTKETKVETKESKKLDTPIDSYTSQKLTPMEKKELPISEKVVIDAIEKANKAISGGNRRFEFAIHDKTKEIMVKVIDSDSGEVVREIPPEKTLDMVAKLWEMAGIVVDERR